MNTAIVEFNSLTNAIRPTTKHHNFAPVASCRLTLFLVGRVHISSRGRELCRTGINPLVHRAQAKTVAVFAYLCLRRDQQHR